MHPTIDFVGLPSGEKVAVALLAGDGLEVYGKALGDPVTIGVLRRLWVAMVDVNQASAG